MVHDNEGGEFCQGYRSLLRDIGEDPGRGGLRGTPGRVQRALYELTWGLRVDRDEFLAKLQTAFELDNGKTGIVAVADIRFVSLCEHHMFPFVGKASVGYIPNVINGKITVLGLSKLARIVEFVAARPQVQEKMTHQVLTCIQDVAMTEDAIVTCSAEHTCMSLRGVKAVGSYTVTTDLSGKFFTHGSVRDEFYRMVGK